jgi:chromosome segregation ATPase
MAAAAAQHEREAAAAGQREEVLRSELEAKQTELADTTAQLLGVRERYGLLQAEAKRRERDEATMRAQLDVARAQLAEVRGNEAMMRAASEEAKAEAARLRERALRDEHAATALRESLRVAQEKLRVTQAVCERARGEVAVEHGALLEAEAKLSILMQDTERLRERLHAAEQEKSVIMRSMVSPVAAAPAPISPVA